IVGMSYNGDFSSQHAFLWQDGQIIDLNTLISPHSALYLTRALAINDRGEIAGIGDPASCFFDPGCGHAFLLTPCDENGGDSNNEDCECQQDHLDNEGCEDAAAGSTTATRV